MKVIKYGEGYEPKYATCHHCKSEMEYAPKDVMCEYNNLYHYNEDGHMVIQCVQTLSMIECPVCGYQIDVHTDINDG
jgi:hypothetical protein